MVRVRVLTHPNPNPNPNPTQEESGWKLVHADVFRPPAYPICLVASLGTGMQLLAMVRARVRDRVRVRVRVEPNANPNPNPNQACIAIFCAMLGFLSPANRGGAQPQPEP